MLIPQAFFTLARDIKAKMDKKLVSLCPFDPEWFPIGACLSGVTQPQAAPAFQGPAGPSRAWLGRGKRQQVWRGTGSQTCPCTVFFL